ncbi:uncharacterized protein LOC120331930 [Styela clava]
MTDKIMILVYLLVFIIADISGGSSLDKTLCSSATIPDLGGAWVCDDSWLVDYEEDISDYDTFKKWNLYFELPKFYAISKIATRPSKCDPGTSVIARLSASVWDERFIKGDDENLVDAAQSHWITIKVPNVTFIDGLYEEYSGFARRAPYWKLTIEALAIDDDCIPKFMFYARAGIAAMQHFVMELDFPDVDEPLPDSEDDVNAPTGNTCSRVTGVPSEAVSRYRLDTSFYRKYTSAYGIPVMSSSRVDDRALQRACYVVRFMMADRKDLRDHMYRNKGRVAIIGRRETVPMVPEMRQYTWWTRRAAGGTFQNPVNVGAEENMLCERGDGYARNQDIFMHEFAHGIHLIACHTAIPNFNSRLQRSFNYARSRGLWTNTYANTDNREYFAEGVQAFFEQQREGPVGGDGIQNHINTREELKRHDRTLYNIIDELLPCYNDYIPRCNDIGQSKSLGQSLKRDCKDGVGTTETPTTTKSPDTCTDDEESCSNWAASGECQKNPEIMLIICKKSCKVCTTKPPGTTKPSTTTKQTTTGTNKPCIDENDSCARWASMGECEKNPDYMKDKCRKSCNSCSAPSTTSPVTTVAPSTTSSATTTNPVPCTDMEESCSTWAADGECRKNPDIMLVLCKKSCKACTTKPPASSTTSPVTTVAPSTTSSATTTNPVPCTDMEESCSTWAADGECQKSPDIMLALCKKSCKACTTKPPGTTISPNTTKPTTTTTTTTKTATTTTRRPTTTTNPPEVCLDENHSCSYWASIGECERNPGYMKDKCRKSCEECSGSSCSDEDAQCTGWRSYCSSNTYVIRNCKKTCNKC